MARRKVGYWMREGKAKRINIKLIEQILSEKHHCDLVELDLENLVDVDVVFHKLTDLIFDAKQGKLESIQHVKNIEEYFDRMSGRIEIFDPLANIQVIVDRKTMMEAIQRCSNMCDLDKRFYSSGYVHVEEISTLPSQLLQRGYTFPMMCKSRIAQGAQGHDMSLLLNERGLSTVTESNVIVPFIPHNAVLYKVFVCGDRHKTLVRPSITVERLTGQDSYNFHSDTVSKNVKNAPSRVQQDLCCMETMNKVSEVSDELLDHISHWSKVLRKGLGLSLFGYDVLVEEGTGKAYIVDINYMPGYAGFEDFHEVLCAMLARSAHDI